MKDHSESNSAPEGEKKNIEPRIDADFTLPCATGAKRRKTESMKKVDRLARTRRRSGQVNRLRE